MRNTIPHMLTSSNSLLPNPAPTDVISSSTRFATEEEIRTIAAFTNEAPLTGKQKDQIMNIWIECSSQEERKQIAILYSKLFSDVGFVGRLQAKLGLMRQQQQDEKAKGGAAGNNVVSPTSGVTPTSPSTTDPSFPSHSPSALFGHQLQMLRKAVEDAVTKLSGPGPFMIEFGLVEDEVANREVIELFHSQFVHPDLSDLQKMITVPKKMSTRSRQASQQYMSLTWFIKSVTNNEICCAVSCHVHNTSRTMRFVEVPLFATRQGYQKMGLARLLTAALKSYCRSHAMHYLLVSADPKAVPFWTALGLKPIDNTLKNRIDKSECYDFKGSEVMFWRVPEGMEDDAGVEYAEDEEDDDNATDASASDRGNYVAETLKKMEKFLLRGPLDLPTLNYGK